LRSNALPGSGDQAGIDAETEAADQTFIHAALQHGLEQIPEQAALAKAAVAVLGKCRMIGHRIGQIEPAKPPIRQMDMDLFAEPPLGPHAHAIAQQQHADHEFGIDRRAAARPVERCQQRPHMRQIEEPVDTTNRVIPGPRTLRSRTRKTARPAQLALALSSR